MNANPIKGTYDYLPKSAELRDCLKRMIIDEYMLNGFSLISTPILESLSILNKSEGGDNLKLMFKTVKRGNELNLSKENLTEDDIVSEGLRYDLTVPLLRMYANNIEKLPKPFKSIQVDYSFRAEKPQKGRDRQFIQCDIDILGDDSSRAEIEIISTVMSVYKKIGLKNITMKLNSKKILHDLISNAGFDETYEKSICISLDKLDKLPVEKVSDELLSKGFEKQKVDILINSINDIKTLGLNALKKYGVKAENISSICYILDTLKEVLPKGFNCVFDVTIVRGQEYYTDFVYEAYSNEFSRAIGGGGRYDKISQKLLGVNIPAVGFGLGFEPTYLILEKTNKIKPKKLKLALIYSEEDFVSVLKLKNKLMKKYKVSIYKRPKNVSNLLDKLNQANFDCFIEMKNAFNLDNVKMLNKGE